MAMYVTPNWFFGYELAIDLASVIIALAVCFFAFKIFKLTGQKQPKLFGISFLLIASSYLVQLLVTEIVLLQWNETIEGELISRGWYNLSILGVYIYMAFFIAGLLTLAYMTFNIKSRGAYVLMLLISGVAMLLGSSQLNIFFLLSATILLFILYHYTLNFIRHRHLTNFLVMAAFILFFAGAVNFFLVPHYVGCLITGNILELAGMILILTNLVLVVRR